MALWRRRRSPPELMEDLVEEILLHLPPADPACLVRASVVCKPWRRLLSDPGFRRRYRAFHRTPPMLGFLHTSPIHGDISRTAASFAPTAGFFSPRVPGADHSFVLDCRHGRVLLDAFSHLVVWDPMTGERHVLREPHGSSHEYHHAAVLCAAAGAGCDHDHGDCDHDGPFLVVFIGTNVDDDEGFTFASVYSSETGAWGAPASLHQGHDAGNCYIDTKPSALIGGALYFFLAHFSFQILRYGMGDHSLSVIHTPGIADGGMVLMPAEDGGGDRLGLAILERFKLYLCVLETHAPHGAAEAWAARRVVDLSAALPPVTRCGSQLHGFAAAAETILASTDDGVYAIELKSLQVRRIFEDVNSHGFFPYLCFYSPDYAGHKLQSPASHGNLTVAHGKCTNPSTKSTDVGILRGRSIFQVLRSLWPFN